MHARQVARRQKLIGLDGQPAKSEMQQLKRMIEWMQRLHADRCGVYLLFNDHVRGFPELRRSLTVVDTQGNISDNRRKTTINT
ncbi:hypothetical protein D3C84_938770 [compost metagenome]